MEEFIHSPYLTIILSGSLFFIACDELGLKKGVKRKFSSKSLRLISELVAGFILIGCSYDFLELIGFVSVGSDENVSTVSGWLIFLMITLSAIWQLYEFMTVRWHLRKRVKNNLVRMAIRMPLSLGVIYFGTLLMAYVVNLSGL